MPQCYLQLSRSRRVRPCGTGTWCQSCASCFIHLRIVARQSCDKCVLKMCSFILCRSIQHSRYGIPENFCAGGAQECCSEIANYGKGRHESFEEHMTKLGATSIIEVRSASHCGEDGDPAKRNSALFEITSLSSSTVYSLSGYRIGKYGPHAHFQNRK